jgi:hypothetical protein
VPCCRLSVTRREFWINFFMLCRIDDSSRRRDHSQSSFALANDVDFYGIRASLSRGRYCIVFLYLHFSHQGTHLPPLIPVQSLVLADRQYSTDPSITPPAGGQAGMRLDVLYSTLLSPRGSLNHRTPQTHIFHIFFLFPPSEKQRRTRPPPCARCADAQSSMRRGRPLFGNRA